MAIPYFLDTNILVYATSLASDHQSRREVARTWMARTDWGVSTQVLMELYAQARQPRHGLLPTAAQALVERIAAHRPVVPVDKDTVLEALALRHRHYLSHWDAAILCAARRMGAHTVVSEDMVPGQDYGGLRVLNPFEGALPVPVQG
ncbi:MAG: PIN domain-containing protein [Rubrivivax sp.]|nr:PIN domain-containing protein [Rubrivivax sp.]